MATSHNAPYTLSMRFSNRWVARCLVLSAGLGLLGACADTEVGTSSPVDEDALSATAAQLVGTYARTNAKRATYDVFFTVELKAGGRFSGTIDSSCETAVQPCLRTEDGDWKVSTGRDGKSYLNMITDTDKRYSNSSNPTWSSWRLDSLAGSAGALMSMQGVGQTTPQPTLWRRTSGATATGGNDAGAPASIVSCSQLRCEGDAPGGSQHCDYNEPTLGAPLQPVCIGNAPLAQCTATVDPLRSLAISLPAFTSDPRATSSTGSWNVLRRFADMVPAGGNLGAFVSTWFASQGQEQNLNGHSSEPRDPAVLAPWLARWATNGAFDAAKFGAAWKLIAITYRPDLSTNAGLGEARMVYGLVDPDNSAGFRQGTLIFEYALPIPKLANGEPIEAGRARHLWGRRFARLSTLERGSTAYLNELEGLTRAFAGPNLQSAPVYTSEGQTRAVNGNPIAQVRTNELVFAGGNGSRAWQMREWRLVSQNGVATLRPVSVKENPADAFRQGTAPNQDELLGAIRDNQAAVLAMRWSVPEKFLGATSTALTWSPNWQGLSFPAANGRGPRTAMPESVRAAFIKNTCAGCHLGESGVRNVGTFYHVQPVNPDATGKRVFSTFVLEQDMPVRMSMLRGELCATTDRTEAELRAAQLLPDTASQRVH